MVLSTLSYPARASSQLSLRNIRHEYVAVATSNRTPTGLQPLMRWTPVSCDTYSHGTQASVLKLRNQRRMTNAKYSLP
eukprot:874080-Amphidinium_carterae.1